MRAGDAVAANHLWERYFHRLMSMARSRMGQMSRTSYDEEDAALSTFNILCRKLQDGHYAEIADRDELWQLMLTVLLRKIGRRVKYESAAKRTSERHGGGPAPVEMLPGPTSQEISHECFELISKLQDSNLEQVALMKFEGYTNDEIATKLNRTRRTVQRMLNLIRDLWQEEIERESY